MKRPAVIVAGVIATALLSTGIIGSGTASADYEGQTYAKAAEKIGARGRTPVISTVIGDQLATDDCIVTSGKPAGFLNSSGTAENNLAVLLNLNCNEPVAKAGVPGNSAATPQGKRALVIQARADSFNAHPERCVPGAKSAESCASFCERYASYCSADTLKAISG